MRYQRIRRPFRTERMRLRAEARAEKRAWWAKQRTLLIDWAADLRRDEMILALAALD